MVASFTIGGVEVAVGVSDAVLSIVRLVFIAEVVVIARVVVLSQVLVYNYHCSFVVGHELAIFEYLSDLSCDGLQASLVLGAWGGCL